MAAPAAIFAARHCHTTLRREGLRHFAADIAPPPRRSDALPDGALIRPPRDAASRRRSATPP